MKIDIAAPGEIRAVALAMRERDVDEFSAVNFADTREELAALFEARYEGNPAVMCACWKDRPACIGGALENRPGVASLLFYATDEFPKIALPMTRWLRNELFPRLLDEGGIHRIEAAALDGRKDVRAWLYTLGLQPETGPLFGYGKRGEPFIMFSKVNDVRPPRAA